MNRITQHPVLGPLTGSMFEFRFDDVSYSARPGDSIAAALLAHGVRTLRRNNAAEPRGIYCGIGHCFECRVTVDGRPGVRACLTEVEPGADVRSSDDRR